MMVQLETNIRRLTSPAINIPSQKRLQPCHVLLGHWDKHDWEEFVWLGGDCERGISGRYDAWYGIRTIFVERLDVLGNRNVPQRLQAMVQRESTVYRLSASLHFVFLHTCVLPKQDCRTTNRRNLGRNQRWRSKYLCNAIDASNGTGGGRDFTAAPWRHPCLPHLEQLQMLPRKFKSEFPWRNVGNNHCVWDELPLQNANHKTDKHEIRKNDTNNE